eukprot:1182421-Prorocentrum_minimum.AAC.4
MPQQIGIYPTILIYSYLLRHKPGRWLPSGGGGIQPSVIAAHLTPTRPVLVRTAQPINRNSRGGDLGLFTTELGLHSYQIDLRGCRPDIVHRGFTLSPTSVSPAGVQSSRPPPLRLTVKDPGVGTP